MRETVWEPEKEIPVMGRFDVAVVGAGLAGCCAAISAGRKGVKTVLIERGGMLGGVSTASLMSSITNFFFTSEDRQVIKTLPAEIVERAVKGSPLENVWKTHKVNQIPHNVENTQNILFSLLRDAQVTILLHSFVYVVLPGKDWNTLDGIVIAAKAGSQAVLAKQIVDCSGDADIAALAGDDTITHAADYSTLMFEMSNVDTDALMEYFVDHPQDYDDQRDIPISFQEFVKNYYEKGQFHIPHSGGKKISILQNAIASGRFERNRGLARDLDALGLFGLRGTGRLLVNSNFFDIHPVQDIAETSQAELEGREAAAYVADFLIRNMPGFEKAIVSRTGAELGNRLARQISGKRMLRLEEYVQNRVFDDVVAYTSSYYRNPEDKGMVAAPGIFGIPYGILLPSKTRNLIIGSGKSISAERLLQRYCLRGQANTMLFGEIAGLAAATAAQSGIALPDLNPACMRAHFA
ncbi:MAG TPA: FAD-dependent oxidoreductase [Clostridia bacterium]|nr:FAD-dependent oxidoreductase [Clostridia bacterium]